MNILICICTYKRNNILNKCLMSFNKAIIPFNFNIKFLIIDNTINGNAKSIVNKIKKNLITKLSMLMKKERIVYARNKCLGEVKKINCDYFSFLDDDCEIDQKWFVNFKKTINTYKVKIITGPQIHKGNGKIKIILRLFLKKK